MRLLAGNGLAEVAMWSCSCQYSDTCNVCTEANQLLSGHDAVSVVLVTEDILARLRKACGRGFLIRTSILVLLLLPTRAAWVAA